MGSDLEKGQGSDDRSLECLAKKYSPELFVCMRERERRGGWSRGQILMMLIVAEVN